MNEKKILADFNKNLDIYLNQNKNLSLLKKDIFKLKKNILDKKNFHIVIKNFESNPKKIENKIIKFSKLFGTPLAQNKLGNKFVKIKPNVRLIKKRKTDKKVKLRYHQTNAGGAIHSDGPQLSTPPKYVIMGCIRQAKKGGFSIVSSAEKISNFLQKNRPDILKTLQQNFYFERRGFNYSNKNIFNKPIYSIKKNNFKFRYLREYIEAAYTLKSISLSNEKIDALNFLDNLLKKKQFQHRYKLNEGDIIILNNNHLAHGRSSFKIEGSEQRSLMRVWTK